MYMEVFKYYIIEGGKVEGGWLSNAYPCLKRSQNCMKMITRGQGGWV